MIASEELVESSVRVPSAAPIGAATSKNTDTKPYKSLFFNVICGAPAALTPKHSRNTSRYANVADRTLGFLSFVLLLDEKSRVCGSNNDISLKNEWNSGSRV